MGRIGATCTCGAMGTRRSHVSTKAVELLGVDDRLGMNEAKTIETILSGRRGCRGRHCLYRISSQQGCVSTVCGDCILIFDLGGTVRGELRTRLRHRVF